ncbi:MAG: hypothetical protein EBZ93_10425 [Actinobacteria bacterium]|nr:hypothetical protein [Actinomycetota bacterium]
MAKTMTDEERYGKVGAAIRKLDPEAYKNRPKTLEGNLKLLKQLQQKSSEATPTPARQMSADEFMEGVSTRQMGPSSSTETYKSRPQNPRRYPGQGAAERQATRATEAMKRSRSMLPSDRATGFRSEAEATGLTADERAEKARDYAKNIAITAATSAVGGAAASPYARTVGQFRRAADKAAEMEGKILARKGVPSEVDRYRAGEEAIKRRAEFRAKKEAEKALAAERERSSAAASSYADRMKLMRDTAEARARMGRGSTYKHGGSVKKYAGGGSVSSASRRADGIAKKGKTRGKIC